MNNKRLLLRVILKAMIFLSLLVFTAVLLKSFTPFFNTNTKTQLVISVDVTDMRPEEIRKTRLQGKEVAVLRRSNVNLSQSNQLDKNGLDSKSRSIKKQYFVYYNTGDSGSCPLQYASETFKDICTGKAFNTTGRDKNNPLSGIVIEIPPHYFEEKTVNFGQWSIP